MVINSQIEIRKTDERPNETRKRACKKSIESCIFSAPSVSRYEEAMQILEMRYGQKNGVIWSHRQELMNGKAVSETIADFEMLANELKCFYSVLIHYSVNLEYFSGELVRDCRSPII